MRLLTSLSLLLACTAEIHAQVSGPCPPLQYVIQTWVDPVNGNNGTAMPGNKNLPFQTLDLAIQSTWGALGGAGEGLVTALPGVYSFATNGELLPIRMRDHVHVRGIGAKECVLRGDGLNWIPLPANWSFLPTRPAPGTHPIGGFEVGFWFQHNAQGDAEASVENFTIQNCQVQAYFRGEQDVAGRISNCLFDLRSIHPISVPDFGVLIVDPAQAVSEEEVTYHSLTPKIFNNTFIQATKLGDGTTSAAVSRNVAICNVNDPAPFGTLLDFTPFLFGPNTPHIQNNLIRDLPSRRRTALLGIDNNDTTVAFGTVLGPTNAFHRNEALSVDLTGTWEAQILGPTPVPKVDLALPARDPGFVGEIVGALKAAQGLSFTALLDFRLVPDSTMIEQGSSPLYTTNLCSGTFTAVNGTTYTDHPVGAWEHGSFNYDGEGHANLRTVRMTGAVAETDIGFDEADNLLVTGSYGNESKSHNVPWDPTVNAGDSNRAYLAPFVAGAPATQLNLLGTSLAYPLGPAWDFYPGLAPLSPPFVPGAGMAPSIAWLTTPTALLGSFAMTPITVPGIVNPLATHTFLIFQAAIVETAGPGYFNEQAVFTDFALNPILISPLNRLSNGQSEIF